MNSGSCADAYTEARSNFEAILYSSIVAWAFLTVIFIPKNEEQQQQQRRRRCCDFLVPCLRATTFCFEPCRPLLEKDENKVAAAAQDVGTCCSVSYILLFVLLQALLPLALIVGIAFFYPDCPCSNSDYCKCTFKIDFIPVGSCTGVAIFFASVVSLGSFAFIAKAVRTLRIIQSARSYSTTLSREQELV